LNDHLVRVLRNIPAASGYRDGGVIRTGHGRLAVEIERSRSAGSSFGHPGWEAARDQFPGVRSASAIGFDHCRIGDCDGTTRKACGTDGEVRCPARQGQYREEERRKEGILHRPMLPGSQVFRKISKV
jgi:hypothetical protein